MSSFQDIDWWNTVNFIPCVVTHTVFGDSGDNVKRIQLQLQEQGYSIAVTDHFDDALLRTVKAFQHKHQLVEDGRVGPKTQVCLNGHPCDPHWLSQTDVEDAAVILGVSVATVMTFNAVESRGLGFLDSERPTVVYERHIMRQRLADKGVDPTHYLSKYPDLIGRHPDGGHVDQAGYDHLVRAAAINEEAALESTGWGLFQLMGYHWQRLGFASVHDMVTEMKRGERHQLLTISRFIKADPVLHETLRNREWTAFSRRYNGPAGHKHTVSEKLQAQFAAFSRPCAK